MVNKHMYSICIYNSLLINVSVSLIVSEVLLHMTGGGGGPINSPLREDSHSVDPGGGQLTVHLERIHTVLILGRGVN